MSEEIPDKSIRINPRWEEAPFERVVILHGEGNFHDPYPLRFDTPDVDLSNPSERGIPWFLVTREDGSTYESF